MKFLNRLIILAALLLCLVLCLFWALKERSVKLRYKDNLEAEIFRNGQQVIVTEKEYSRLYSEIDSLSLELGKKPKHIVQIVKVDYRVTDTMEIPLYGDTLFLWRNDTVFVQPDTLWFDHSKPCYHLTGYVYDKKIVAAIDYRDSPVMIFERQRSKRFLFIKYGRWKHSAMFYSKCSGKLMWIEENILIDRK
ncbi:MAG: hypothetical protein K0B15_12300 [Lentimicrobium sp.]|nr:hypothetical protein [Lentimicrobium sp.]